MKTNHTEKLAALLTVACLTLSPSLTLAQDASATDTASSATTAPAPQLAYGVSQIVQLSQAKVGDDTIVAYVKNSGNSYGLTADQIIYLQQQGVSTAVINAMLSQPKPGVLTGAPAPIVATTAAPDTTTTSYSPPASSTSIVGPSVTAIDPTYSAVTYSYSYYPYYPYYSYPYYYPAYGYYGCSPGVVLSFGWRGGYGWHGGYGGYGWHGGYGYGWHGGGGFHGGWHR